MQVTQQVYVAEEWVQSAYKKFNAKSQSRREVERALGTANHEKMQLTEKLKATESVRQNAEAKLKMSKPKLRISASSSTLHKLTLPPRRQRI